MKTHRNRFGFKKRSFGKKTTSTVTFKRLSIANVERLEMRNLLTGSPWQNPVNAFDVNGDSHVTPVDALSIINQLSSQGSSSAASAAPMLSALAMTTTTTASAANSTATPFTDVNGDGQVTPLDVLSEINQLDAIPPIFEYRLEAEDMGGNVITSIAVGQDYQLVAFVQDLRSPTPTNAGAFAGFVNVAYDSSLASISAGATVVHDSFYTLTSAGDVSVAGHITGAGGAATSLSAPGAAAHKLWSVKMHADAAGTESFTTSFDSVIGHDTLLYGSNDTVTQSQIQFDTLQLSVNAGSTVSISPATISKAEAASVASPFQFTVSLSGPAITQNATVVYNTGGGTATSGQDYIGSSGTLTFTVGGPTSQVVSVTGIDDFVSEANETFNVTLSGPSSNLSIVTASAQATIIDDDPLPTVSVADFSHAEGNSGTTPFLVTVSLSTASGQNVTVNYATQDGTAVSASGAGQDYQPTSGTLTFLAGQTSKVVTVNVLGDTTNEANETFSVILSAPSAATLGTSTGVVTIINDDLPVLSVDSIGAVLTEGNSGQKPFVFTVNLSTVSAAPVTVVYATADGNGADSGTNATIANNDYAATSGTLTFASGVTSQLVTVMVNGDTSNEQNENFRLVLSNPSQATIDSTHGTGVATILNDDGPVVNIVAPSTITLPSSGTTDAVFHVNLAIPSAIPITVVYATQDGTASVANGDYVAQSGTLTFAANEISKDITVAVNGKAGYEPDETFAVNLTDASPSSAATIQQSLATATLHSNATAPTVSLATSSLNVTAGNTALFTVNLSAAAAVPVTVFYHTQDGTATIADNDYTGASGTLTFAAGVTQQVITVSVLADTKNEADEDFTLDLTGGTNITQPGDPIVGTAVVHTSVAPPSLSMANVTQTDVTSGDTNFVFTATLSAASGQQILVNYTTADGTATVANGDYAATSGTLTFAPGDVSGKITVVVHGKSVYQPNESFAVNLTGSASTVSFTNSSATGTIVSGIAPPTLSISNYTHAEGNSGTTPFLFTITLSAGSNQAVTVGYSTADGNPPDNATTANSDYVAQSGTLTFATGETSKVVTVLVNGDVLYETGEQFFVNLTNPVNATIPTDHGVGSGIISNDDPAPTLTIANVSHVIADSGLQPFVFQASISAPSGLTTTIVYATADGTATIAKGDYQAASGTLTFAPGTTTQNITVNVVGNLFQQPDENFFVNLSSPSNVFVPSDQAIGTIQSNPNHTATKYTASIISGVAFVDVNGNGIQDAGEKTLSGISISVKGTSSITNSPVSQQVTTAADGSYSFDSLLPGTYAVTYSQPSQFLPATVSAASALNANLTTDSAHNVVLNTIIVTPGGIQGTHTNLMVHGLQPGQISQRSYLASSGTASSAATPAASQATSLASPQVSATSLVTPQASPAATTPSAAQTATPSLRSTLASSGVSNLITQSGSIVTVHGTSGDDNFSFVAGAMDTVTMNGVTRQFDPAVVDSIIFDGGAGKNTATLTGSTGNDVASFGLGSGTLSGARFKVSVSNVTSLSVHGGGGNDSATLQDSALSDHLQASGNQASITNDLGLITTLLAFSQVKAQSTHGGSDTAHVGAVDFTLQQEGSWLQV